MAQITFYQGENFHGRAFTTTREEVSFRRDGFNDRASSVIVDGGRWEVCEDARYSGHCVLLRPGSYDSLRRMGLNNRISSARRVSRWDDRDRDEWADPMPSTAYEYRRRPNERVYEARVTSVHAVMGRPEKYCWVERDQVQGKANVAGGIVGGIIGGILGHEIVGGSGQGIATVGGAAAGAAIGANAGRDHYDTVERRCERVEDGPPDFWDVSYTFHHVEHHVQMSEPPGRTIYVNRYGEPRQ